MKIAIIGPTHPYSGGIATHTTTLANQLSAAGHSVEMISWKAQYPKFLRGGMTRVPEDEPEVAPHPGATFPLAWYSPISWLRIGRALRRADLVVVTAVTPYHAIPYLAMRAAFGRRPSAVVIAHNVLPHEGGPLDKRLVRRLYRGFGRVLTHSEEQAALAKAIAGDVRVGVARLPLPDFLFGDGRSALEPAGLRSGRQAHADGSSISVGFFGMVREYKGVDLLLRAAADVPSIRVVIAGEFWQPVEEFRALVDELDMASRVEIIDGYVAMADLPGVLRRLDVLALPYRSGSATFNVSLGFLFGLPVLVTSAGTMRLDVADDVNGIVVEAGQVDALRRGLEYLLEPGVVERLQSGVASFDLAEQWSDYVSVLTSLSR